MSADVLLAKLDGVRQTGQGRWLAKCPAHADRSPSLSIRELADGRTLCHCHAGCAVVEVLQAVGLGFDALFPARALDHRVRRERDPFNARDVLFALADETQVAAIVAARVAYGYDVDFREIDRLMTAVARIATAADLFRPHPANGRRTCPTRAENDEIAEAMNAAA